MPLYEFKCADCGASDEEFCSRKNIGTMTIPCPNCGSPMKRAFTAAWVIGDVRRHREPIAGPLGEKILEHPEFKNVGKWDRPRGYMPRPRE